MFKAGDTVVHPQFGAGLVTEIQTITYQGQERTYFCIELVEKRGTLMLPLEQIEDAGLRLPMTDITKIKEILEQTPQLLIDDPHPRQLALEQKINTGDSVATVEVLRDLSWRECVGKLTLTDRKLKETVLTKIVEELTIGSRFKVGTVKLEVENLVQQAMQGHMALRNAE